MKGLLLTYLLAYGGGAVALFNPFVGVCIYWIFDIVRPQYMFGWAGTQGSFSAIIAAATIAGWVFRGSPLAGLGRARPLILLFVAFNVWMLLSAAAAQNHEVAAAFVVEQAKRAIMFAIAVAEANSVRRLRQLAWTLTGSAGYLAFELNMRYLNGFNEAQLIGYGGLDNNGLAISMVTCLGVAVFLALYERKWWSRSAALVAAALVTHVVLITFSRGGMLSMIAAGGAALAVIPKRPRYLVGMFAALLVIISFTGPELRARFMSSFADAEERDGSAQSRLDLWLDCVEVVRKYPVLGVGPNHFPLIAEEFGWPAGKEAHSLWFQVAAEGGIPGAALLVLFYTSTIILLWRLSRGARGSEESWHMYAGCMTVTSLTGFACGVQFVTILGLETPLYVAVIAIGTLRLASDAGHAAAGDRSRDADAMPFAAGRVRSPWPISSFPTPPRRPAGVPSRRAVKTLNHDPVGAVTHRDESPTAWPRRAPR